MMNPTTDEAKTMVELCFCGHAIEMLPQWNQLVTCCMFHISRGLLIWITTGEGRYIIYTYCMYTIKLRALILSIVFNYLRFLMKIDCTKFFCILRLCMLPEQMKKVMDGTPILMSQLLTLVYKKRKLFLQSLPIMMHKLNICNSGFLVLYLWYWKQPVFFLWKLILKVPLKRV